MQHPNPKTQKLLDDMHQRTESATAFADNVMKLVDEFVPVACKDLARKKVTDVAMRLGLQMHQTREPK
jgi:hypothetical protein